MNGRGTPKKTPLASKAREHYHLDNMLLARLIDFYSLIVLGAVIVSWIQLPPYHPIVRFLNTLTEPALAPIRKLLPSMGGLDFSPMVLLVGLQLIKGMLF